MACLDLTKLQDWLDPKNFEVLAREYCLLRESLFLQVNNLPELKLAHNDSASKEPLQPAVRTGKAPTQAVAVKRKPAALRSSWSNLSNLNNSRQQKIVEVLKNKGSAQVKDIESILPQFSKRTLRRDFAYLYKTGAVERMGDGSTTVYRLKADL